ncbi:MAG: hypothetical protein NTW28_08905, partial [Candidatus Solibacter sp.]|nr:hypothetical protein [Candidatus Solibacter sp.]
LLFLFAPAASADSSQRLTWEELPTLVGKRVSIPLYDGGAVAGKVREVQADALLIQVSKSSNPLAYPKGPMRVPRATLHVLDLHGKGHRYRVIGTALGFAAGAACGLGVAIGVQGGPFSDGRGTAGGAALVGVMAGVTTAGYAVGNAADRRTTTVRIIP